jgi:hypothetical protein
MCDTPPTTDLAAATGIPTSRMERSSTACSMLFTLEIMIVSVALIWVLPRWQHAWSMQGLASGLLILLVPILHLGTYLTPPGYVLPGQARGMTHQQQGSAGSSDSDQRSGVVVPGAGSGASPHVSDGGVPEIEAVHDGANGAIHDMDAESAALLGKSAAHGSGGSTTSGVLNGAGVLLAGAWAKVKPSSLGGAKAAAAEPAPAGVGSPVLGVNVCTTCQVEKPLRSKHCRVGRAAWVYCSSAVCIG